MMTGAGMVHDGAMPTARLRDRPIDTAGPVPHHIPAGSWYRAMVSSGQEKIHTRRQRNERFADLGGVLSMWARPARDQQSTLRSTVVGHEQD